MQIKQLVSFITVAQTKNMAQTALALNYSHSTIYSHLEALEKEFRTKLYLRTSHGIELTPEGERFLSYAKQMLQLYEEVMVDFSGVSQSKLRITASEASDVCLMHNILQEYISRFPMSETEYSKTTVDVALSRLAANVCDVCIIAEFHYIPDAFYANYLCTLPLVFVASPTYFSAPSEQPLLPKLIGTMDQQVTKTVLQEVGIDFSQYFSSMMTVGDLNTIRQLLLFSRGIAMLPSLYVQEDLASGHLVRIPELMEEVLLHAYVITPSKKKIGPYTRSLIDIAYERYNPKRLPRDCYVR